MGNILRFETGISKNYVFCGTLSTFPYRWTTIIQFDLNMQTSVFWSTLLLRCPGIDKCASLLTRSCNIWLVHLFLSFTRHSSPYFVVTCSYIWYVTVIHEIFNICIYIYSLIYLLLTFRWYIYSIIYLYIFYLLLLHQYVHDAIFFICTERILCTLFYTIYTSELIFRKTIYGVCSRTFLARDVT